MTQASAVPSIRYRAFISYSHRDKAWADWLHRALERYTVPRRLVGQTTSAGVVPRRLAPIFRDREELASATDLSRQVNEALARSANLVVICSPHAARSRWVNEEVLAFKRLGRGDRIFCLVVAGDPSVAAQEGDRGDACFAPALRHQVGEDGMPTGQITEPVAADVRPGCDSRSTARLKLVAGMLGVGFDALKQREMQRRVRRATALAALALVAMAVTTTLAVTALIARHEAVVASEAAKRRQKQAEDLVGFMLGDLNDKLEQVSRLDIIEAVDDQAMHYFQSLPTTDVTDETLAERAKALVRIGSVRLDQGRLSAAQESFRMALRIADTRVRHDPRDVPRELALAEVYQWLGYTHWYMGRLDAAENDFETAQAALDQTQVRAPGNMRLMYQRTEMENNTGRLLVARGRLDLAERHYRRMLQLCRRLVAADPHQRRWKQQLGNARNNLGRMALLRGDLVGAVEWYAADREIEMQLAASDPRDNSQRRNVELARAILGRTLALGGDMESAVRNLRMAVKTADSLHDLDAANATYSEDRAHYLYQLARLQRLSGDAVAARKSVTTAVEELQHLVRRAPGNATLRRELAEATTEKAIQLQQAGRASAAREAARKALNTMEPLFRDRPHDRETLLATASAWIRVANTSADPAEAARLRKAVLAAVDGESSGRRDPRLLALKVRALLALGRKEEVKGPLKQLWQEGYRDGGFMAELRRAGIRYPVNTEMQQRLRLAVNGGTTH